MKRNESQELLLSLLKVHCNEQQNGVFCRYYIGYKSLKKRIKHYSGRAHASGVTDDERHEIVKSFSELLDSQVGNFFLTLKFSFDQVNVHI